MMIIAGAATIGQDEINTWKSEGHRDAELQAGGSVIGLLDQEGDAVVELEGEGADIHRKTYAT